MAEFDYGARFYDPVMAKWTTIDPLSEVNRKWSPYKYVKNNSIANIDPDGMIDYNDISGSHETRDIYQQTSTLEDPETRNKKKNGPTKMQAAILSNAVYGNYSGSLDGYSLYGADIPGVKYFEDESGFQSALYSKTTSDGETSFVYATAGTQDILGKDGIADGTQLAGLSRQYDLSQKNATLISNYFASTGENVTFVGHSLGGGMAALNSMVTGRSAITLNAQGLSAATMKD